MIQTTLPQTPGLYVQAVEPLLAFPLKHTDVNAQVSGNISRVEVTHTFENPFTTALEAIYVFPLPDEAAVDAMVIRLANRTIQGRIEKREEAEAIYEQAKQKGQTAGLLAQERANIFTQSLANIPPREEIEVVISYSNQLAYRQGSYEFVFPMVVGPRYIPGNPIADSDISQGSAMAPMTLNQDTDLVPDASRLNGPILPAGMRSGHDIQMTLEIETGLEISHLQSPSHQIVVDAQDARTCITLAANDTLPNKDFILRYQVAGDATQTALLTQSDERGGHFAVYLIPAVSYDLTAYIPKDMVFLIDTSGSQSGLPLAQCQALMHRFINGLHPQDTFNIVNFANTTQQLSKVPLENTPRNRQKALDYVARLRAGGGTEMMRGFKTVLNLPHLDLERIRNIVLLTDGYIGNETQIFAEVQRSLSQSSRLHSFGAGSSVNRFLLSRVAELGRGISYVVRPDETTEQVVDTFFNQINHPVLGNLSLHWDGPGAAPSCYPMAMPDLCAEQPLILLGRTLDQLPGTLRIKGITAGGAPFEQSLSLSFESSNNSAIAQLWGRARIKELMNQMVSGETTRGVEAVTETALAYQLLSQYTAFVAVSDDVRIERPGDAIALNVPVLLPDALSHAGVFGAAAPQPVMAPMASPRARRAAAPPMGGLGQKRALPKIQRRQAFAPMPADAIAPSQLPIDLADTLEGADTFEEIAEAAEMPLHSAAGDEFSDPTIAPEPASQLLEPSQQLQVTKVDGLSDVILEQLKHHLQNLQLTAPQTGRLVLKLIVQQGRIKRVMLDAEASDPQTSVVVEQIRRALLTWLCPQLVVSPLRLELYVQP